MPLVVQLDSRGGWGWWCVVRGPPQTRVFCGWSKARGLCLVARSRRRDAHAAQRGLGRPPRRAPPPPPASGGFEEEAGEVAGLGDGEDDRVVAALGEGGEDAGADARVAGGLTADLLEHCGRDVVGAGERDQPAAALEQAEAADIDLLVAARGGLDRVLAAREGRGIEHDQPETLAACVQVPQAVEGIP